MHIGKLSNYFPLCFPCENESSKVSSVNVTLMLIRQRQRGTVQGGKADKDTERNTLEIRRIN